MTDERYVSLREAAKQVGWNRETLRRMAHRGAFPLYRPLGTKMSRCLVSEVRAALRESRVNPTEEAKQRGYAKARAYLAKKAAEERGEGSH
jgi:excisionase family DNA binding protein